MIFGIFIEARSELLRGWAIGTVRAQRPGLFIVALLDQRIIVLEDIGRALGALRRERRFRPWRAIVGKAARLARIRWIEGFFRGRPRAGRRRRGRPGPLGGPGPISYSPTFRTGCR